MTLYHTGLSEIQTPDLKIGRANADFGQGFYLSDNEEFVKRWAKVRKDTPAWLNKYELQTDGLRIKRFTREEAWFEYIFANRSGRSDALGMYDVIIGPIANDTLYDTWGVLTSGLLDANTALELLSVGPSYEQTVIKTEKAAAALRFTGAEILSPDEIALYRAAVRQEEAAFQDAFARKIESLPQFAEDTE